MFNTTHNLPDLATYYSSWSGVHDSVPILYQEDLEPFEVDDTNTMTFEHCLIHEIFLGNTHRLQKVQLQMINNEVVDISHYIIVYKGILKDLYEAEGYMKNHILNCTECSLTASECDEDDMNRDYHVLTLLVKLMEDAKETCKINGIRFEVLNEHGPLYPRRYNSDTKLNEIIGFEEYEKHRINVRLSSDLLGGYGVPVGLSL